MSLRFRGDYGKLEKCVSRIGLDGSWKKLSNGHRQFITDDHGILNWAPSTGRIWFQGQKVFAEELKRKFKAVATARGRITPESIDAQQSLDEDISTLKKLLADALLDNEKLRRHHAG